MIAASAAVRSFSVARRHGYSLIELSVVIALLGGLLSFTGLMLHAMLQTEQTAHQSEQLQYALQGLEQHLRADVSQSAQAALDVNAQCLLLTQTDGTTLRYTLAESVAQRERCDELGEIVHRDTFRLRGCELQWIEPSAVAAGIVQLEIAMPAAAVHRRDASGPLRRVEIRTSVPAFLRTGSTPTQQASVTATIEPAE